MKTYCEGYSTNVSESFKLVYARSLQFVRLPINVFHQTNILQANHICMFFNTKK
jgi:hypothetical protein